MKTNGGEVFYLSDIINRLGGELVGSDAVVNKASSLASASGNDITFYADKKLSHYLNKTQASAVILKSLDGITQLDSISYIITDNPHLYFTRVLSLIYPKDKVQSGVHQSAVIESSVDIPETVEIGPHVYIGENAVIGSKTRILAGTVIESNVTIGENCLIHANVTVSKGTIIGNDVEIHSGAVIGGDGFGLSWNGQFWEKTPQIGRVILKNNVEIGANTTIDRGAIEDTVISEGVKIDNLVHIAHNCKIGEHTAIAAFVGMAGSTEIGKYCTIAGAAKFVGHLTVADHSVIGGATLVTHSIKNAGHYAGGYPMQTYQEWKHSAVLIRRLREMNQKIKLLEDLVNQ